VEIIVDNGTFSGSIGEAETCRIFERNIGSLVKPFVFCRLRPFLPMGNARFCAI
jgi:hypothetical protein